MMETVRNGRETLDRIECLRLLATGSLGRVGLTAGGLPWVVPVAYRFDGERILIRAERGSTLADGARDAVVAFETDRLDPAADVGWSVMATGIAREVSDSAADGCTMAIDPEIISGWRIRPAE
jgi:nitroimidazol reductase NimA-like FMN-containing flavoprotein (pyridoxamine 5'-phosphate oxidase superfamily)